MPITPPEYPHPVIFLDVDGVLNRCGKSKRKLELDLLSRLAKIVSATDCRIVLSSTWRVLPFAMNELLIAFSDLGLQLSGITPDLARKNISGVCYAAKERGHEIQAWIDKHGTPSRFCIIDDNSDMAHLRNNLVLTNSYNGLTEEKANEAILKLKAS